MTKSPKVAAIRAAAEEHRKHAYPVRGCGLCASQRWDAGAVLEALLPNVRALASLNPEDVPIHQHQQLLDYMDEVRALCDEIKANMPD